MQEISNKLARRSEELEEAQRAAASYEDEVARLRQALEKNSADRGGRRLRGASKWSLDDYRAEYDRLNLELSKLRQQIAQLQERDAGQSSLIKGELHKLTELILATAQPKAGGDTERLPAVKRSKSPETRRDRPVPWTGSAPNPPAPATAASEPLEDRSPAAPRLPELLKAASDSPLVIAFAAQPDKSANPSSASASNEPAGPRAPDAQGYCSKQSPKRRRRKRRSSTPPRPRRRRLDRRAFPRRQARTRPWRKLRSTGAALGRIARLPPMCKGTGRPARFSKSFRKPAEKRFSVEPQAKRLKPSGITPIFPPRHLRPPAILPRRRPRERACKKVEIAGFGKTSQRHSSEGGKPFPL